MALNYIFKYPQPGRINFLKDDPQFVALIMAAPFTTPQLPLPYDAPKLSPPFTSIKLSLAIYYPYFTTFVGAFMNVVKYFWE